MELQESRSAFVVAEVMGQLTDLKVGQLTDLKEAVEQAPGLDKEDTVGHNGHVQNGHMKSLAPSGIENGKGDYGGNNPTNDTVENGFVNPLAPKTSAVCDQETSEIMDKDVTENDALVEESDKENCSNPINGTRVESVPSATMARDQKSNKGNSNKPNYDFVENDGRDQETFEIMGDVITENDGLVEDCDKEILSGSQLDVEAYSEEENQRIEQDCTKTAAVSTRYINSAIQIFGS